MKKLLSLVAVVMCLGTLNSFGQACVVDQSCIQGICPDTITNLPTSYVGQAYNTVVTVNVPADTVAFGITLTIDDYTVTGVTGVPTGYTYQCNPSNCVYPGNSSGCMLITGTAPTQGMVGTYPLVVNVDAHLTSPFGSQTQQGQITGYKIVIEDQTVGFEVINDNVFELANNIPNPATSSTNIRFTNPREEKIELNIYNSMGQLVYNQKVDAERGLNTVPVSVAEFAEGVYIYTVSNGKTMLNRRMVVAGK